MLLALKMEGRATSQEGRRLLEAGQAREWSIALKKELGLDFRISELQNSKILNLRCFKPLSLW